MRFVAGRGAVAERLVRGAAVAERHQEDAAPREMYRGRAPSGRCKPAPGSNCERKCQCEAPSGRRCPQGDALRIRIGKMLMTGSGTRKQHREATLPRKAAGKGAAAGFDF